MTLRADLLRTYNLTRGSRWRRLIACYRVPGVHAVVTLRFGQWLSKQHLLLRLPLEPLYLFQYRRMRTLWGIEIPRSTVIGEGLYIGHHGGIIISGATRIGNNVSLSQQVTIGVAGHGDKRGVPVIGDNVYIAPGAKIFGKIVIGNNVKIGANAVVHEDIPDGATVVLEPGYSILKRKDSNEHTHQNVVQEVDDGR